MSVSYVFVSIVQGCTEEKASLFAGRTRGDAFIVLWFSHVCNIWEIEKLKLCFNMLSMQNIKWKIKLCSECNGARIVAAFIWQYEPAVLQQLQHIQPWFVYMDDGQLLLRKTVWSISMYSAAYSAHFVIH